MRLQHEAVQHEAAAVEDMYGEARGGMGNRGLVIGLVGVAIVVMVSAVIAWLMRGSDWRMDALPSSIREIDREIDRRLNMCGKVMARKGKASSFLSSTLCQGLCCCATAS